MDDDTTARIALDTAVATRHASAAHQIPAWFVVAFVTTCPAGFLLLGTSALSGNSVSRVVFGACGLVLLMVYLALWGLLMVRWRRVGVIPHPAGNASAAQRRRLLLLTVAGVIVYAAIWAVTGRVGWAIIYFGAVIGLTSGYQFARRRFR
ncbi:hypothetical protein [Actinoallomurus sp. NPDC050550]|uniref:hypothetical protein n=1 Tax=Actinoallomurus sp. NPDC050550 TaxID=3154937 RepID=UPI0033FD59B6